MAVERGELRFEYFPVPVTPMSVAILILLAAVTFVLGPLAMPPDFYPLEGLCFLPFAAMVVLAVLQRPSPTRIYADGIEVSLPLWRRILGTRRFWAYDEIRNLYPASYEVTGAFLSPFASSAGTLVHVGLAIETVDGARVKVRFTPGVIRAFRAESAGFVAAMDHIRRIYAERGRPLVRDVRHYTDAEIRAMQEEARQPLLSLATIVFAFFVPPGVLAAVLATFPAVLASGPATALLAGVVTLTPPFAAIAWTYRKSGRRNFLLSELSKFRESLRPPAT